MKVNKNLNLLGSGNNFNIYDYEKYYKLWRVYIRK
jgi:hypothetical protein